MSSLSQGLHFCYRRQLWCALPYTCNPIRDFSSEFQSLIDAVPVIRYPQSLKNAIIRRTKPRKMLSKRSALQLAKPGKLLISSNDKADTMYTNDFPNKFSPPTLTSSSWTSMRSPGRHFTIHATRENPSFKESDQSFEEMKLSAEILKALRLINIEKPTVIQAKAISQISKGGNVMMAAETGSGKTLAYLLPIIQHILLQRDDLSTTGESREFVSPKALVLTPTKELSKQVVHMGAALNLPLKFQSLHASSLLKYLKSDPSSPMADVLVTTPVPLILALKKRKLELGSLKFVVLDECDTLCDDSFAKDIQHILSRFNINQGKRVPVAGNQTAQLVLCSATFPKYASDVLADVIEMENIEIIRSGYLHRVSPHVTHQFLRVRPSEKLGELIRLLEQGHEKQTMVFCNYRKTALRVYEACQKHAITALVVGGKVHPKERNEVLQNFKDGNEQLLITTDLSSRGLDTKKVEHVINFEIPNSVSDYVHRCGRVGRVGQAHAGLVTNLVSRRWEVSTVMQIEEAARRREEIGRISANIKRTHKQRWEQKDDLGL